MHSIGMGSPGKNFTNLRLTRVRDAARWSSSGAQRLSRLCKLRECEQVAAVCYRVRSGAIEFLLVQTRGSRRWTFPKGSAEPGLTHAQAAAIEAYEEAGVHGRIEESSFVRYICGKPGSRASSKRSGALAVSAHLCAVRRLCTPKEPDRNRTWFSAEEAKLQLRKGREEVDGDTFARVVDCAAVRIQGLRREADLIAKRSENSYLHRHSAQHNEAGKDPLRIVHLEAQYSINRLAQGGQLATRLVNAPTSSGVRPQLRLPLIELPGRTLRLLTGPKKLKA